MVVLAVLIPLLMLGVVLALGRYEELLLPVKEAMKEADPGEDAPTGPLGATVPLGILPSPPPSGTGPARPAGR